MLRSEKRLTELGKALSSGSRYEIRERIGLLRNEEPFEGALKMLALFYDSTDDEGIKQMISGFFNDMKDRSGCSEVIESILSVSNPASKAMLASSCWQSGLDYSEHAVALAEIFMLGDYMTSLECFTVLDTCSGMIANDDKTLIISTIERDIKTFDEPKQRLASELITIMRE
jgi:hypothetical protein